MSRLYTPRRGIQPEERLHLDVAAFLQVALRGPTYWTTVGHGSKVGRREAAMLKAKGLKAGFPDILVIHPTPIGFGLGCTVVCPELKAEHGRRSADQVAAHAQLVLANAHVGVCRSVEDVAELLQAHGIPIHARVLAGGGFMVRTANIAQPVVA